MTTILIAGGGTGGHLMPALAIADAIVREGLAWRVVLVGAQRGVEARLLPQRSYPFHLLPAEPIYRRQWWKNARWPLIGWRLVKAADAVLEREHPDLVLGTGGYAAGPLVWRAARRGIPTAIFEADAMPGVTSRLLARRVDQIYLANPEAEARLRPGRGTQVQVTGAPVPPPQDGARAQGRAAYGVAGDRPVVLIFGGSQGALAINQAVAHWLAGDPTAGLPAAVRGPTSPQVIWATGVATHDRFAHLHDPPHVHVIPFLDPIAPAYAVADLAVARAGMMTIAELCVWGIPSILIPLPSAAADHQAHNAMAMAGAGAAIHLTQDDLTPRRLQQEVGGLLADQARLARLGAAARARGRPGAGAAILDNLKGLLRSF